MILDADCSRSRFQFYVKNLR